MDIRGFNMDILIWTLQNYTKFSHKIMLDYLSYMLHVTWFVYTDSIPQSSIILKYDGQQSLTFPLTSEYPIHWSVKWGPGVLVERVGPHSEPWATAITWFGYRVLGDLSFPLFRNQIFAWNCHFLWIWGRDDLREGLVDMILFTSLPI